MTRHELHLIATGILEDIDDDLWSRISGLDLSPMDCEQLRRDLTAIRAAAASIDRMLPGEFTPQPIDCPAAERSRSVPRPAAGCMCP